MELRAAGSPVGRYTISQDLMTYVGPLIALSLRLAVQNLVSEPALRSAQLPSGELSGIVKDASGAVMANVFVFASDVSTDRISSFGISSAEGRVTLRLPPTRHDFGVVSPTHTIMSVAATGTRTFAIVVRPLPSPVDRRDGENELHRLVLREATLVRGRVVDETGGVLGAVRIEALRSSSAVASATYTDSRGYFALGLPAGRYRIRVTSPGLRPAKFESTAGRLDVVMTVDAHAEHIRVENGHVLRFRLDRSSDPEVFPPAPVRAWLCFSYGIVIRSRFPTSSERRRLKKYWYLDLLRQPPANPAKTMDFDKACLPEDGEPVSARLNQPGSERPLIEQLGGGPLPSSIFAPIR